MTLYRFSPIETREQFDTALEYVSIGVGDLVLKLCGERMPVPILKLFAHYPSEYPVLEAFVNERGARSDVSSGNSHYADVSPVLTVSNADITLLGVRRADPYRTQVGCGDCIVEDFAAFAARIQERQPDFARPVNNEHGLSMIELWHPDFDVLGYIIPPQGSGQ